MMDTPCQPSPGEVWDAELCIVGAGYAALNGLNVAAKYLKKGERVAVIDKNDTWGGQWIHQYDFVRLHQPYRMFTAGDQKWTLDRDPSYLATRREVMDHLLSIPAVSAGHLQIRPLFGHRYTGHRIRDGRAEVDAVPVGTGTAAGRTVRIRARRLLKATGADIEMLPPFQLSSAKVRSVSVSDPVLQTAEFLESSAPVYIIGGGKTAMDTVGHVLAQSRTRRALHLILGSGMWFFVRDNSYPSGLGRYTRGSVAGDALLHIAQMFDGTNEADVMAALEREGMVMSIFGPGGNCRNGLLSLAERDGIRAGVTEVHRAHLVDVDGTRMILREGAGRREVSVAEDSWFVNCTSHLRQFPHEPILQDSGITCAPQFALGFTGTSAYFVSHLWFRNKLAAVAPELFRVRLDVEPKLRFAPQVAVMVLANMVLASAHLPPSIPMMFEGDVNKWYPVHRQIRAIARIIAARKEILDKAERLLNQRFSDAPEFD